MNELNEKFSELYNETYSSILNYVISKIKNIHDTNDVLQTVYISLYRLMNNRGVLPTEQALKILYTSARHEIGRYYGFVKYQKRLVPTFSEDETDGVNIELLSYNLSNVDDEFDQELLDIIWDFISKKDELTYRAFLLHYVQGLTFKECANLLKCSNSTIVHRVYRTIEEVKKIYKEDNKYERKEF
ncbi:RNA polymerase sigma factor [Ruminiclostridium papyrosolvens]|uniref:Uncharacterized protein n=1 Tax=Ruminiclostridium papyrosolvens C7 TaxID=1330534 RepID=U4R5H2_9FIRM|nr:RNA polymerase sigma factor [Ruminiclostridium papyrosolvens]EPR13905.1 hypothetical protein L323_02225 [Ruminiclostridium papyrosolvens C7]